MKGYARCQNDIPNYKERFHHLGITKESLSVRTSATESPTKSFISICKLRFKLLPKQGDILAALDVELPGALNIHIEVIEGGLSSSTYKHRWSFLVFCCKVQDAPRR